MHFYVWIETQRVMTLFFPSAYVIKKDFLENTNSRANFCHAEFIRLHFLCT